MPSAWNTLRTKFRARFMDPDQPSKFPWMRKDFHLNKLRMKQQHFDFVCGQLREEAKLNREFEHRMAEILNRLAAVTIERPIPGDSLYRVSMTFSPWMIRDVLMWGNDQQAILHISEHMGRMIMRELTTANLHRFKDSQYGMYKETL